MFFVDPDSLTLDQLLWAFVSYGYVLYLASELISNGSELLLLIPKCAGIVGSIVLPILGAVPDGMMVLFSGFASDVEKAQQKVAVGIGAQAGSTIMVLTVPLFAAIWAGRVDIRNGRCDYRGRVSSKLTKKFSLFSSGVEPTVQTSGSARLMLATSLTYFIVQIPALFVDPQGLAVPDAASIGRQSSSEEMFVLVGLVLCIAQFCYYLYAQYRAANPRAADENFRTMAPQHSILRTHTNLVPQFGLALHIAEFREEHLDPVMSQRSLTESFLQVELKEPLKSILRDFYGRYKTSSLGIDRTGLSNLLKDLNVHYTKEKFEELFNQVDQINEPYGFIDFMEFQALFKQLAATVPTKRLTITRGEGDEADNDSVNSTDSDLIEDDMPEDFKDLPEDVQRCRLIFRSAWMMGTGTAMVLVFSDPMVDVLNAAGQKLGINPFYISFLLAPLAANASELVSSYNYALKKTPKSMGIALAQLHGAGCMNNTYVLGVFFALIYTQGLAWRFTAETLSIFFVEIIIYIITTYKSTLTLADGFLVLALYPASMFCVWLLESLGLD